MTGSAEDRKVLFIKDEIAKRDERLGAKLMEMLRQVPTELIEKWVKELQAREDRR